MARLYFFVEGETELVFADKVLKPHLAPLGVYLYGPILIAHSFKHGYVHRGGGRNYGAMRRDIANLLKQERGADVFATTMIDLYALASDFPELASAAVLRNVPYQRIGVLESAFAQDLPDPRFIPYIQLHEFEAILLSDPQRLNLEYDDASAIARLCSLAQDHESPELINDGPSTSPGQRIQKELPGYATEKPRVGPRVAAAITLPVIRQKCPHFHQWLSQLESLGSAPNPASEGESRDG